MQWHFSRKAPAIKTRDPIASEFFAQDAITNAGAALIREGIQNSLDARKDRVQGKARVRIFVSGEPAALEPSRVNYWFNTGWPHLTAPKNGLKPGTVMPGGRCRFLVFEDFETTGLTGDPGQTEPSDDDKNAFFYFFRAEGKTQKGGDDNGRWGIGKQVFPRSSKAQAFFGYTVTDRGGMLMGGCILKNHELDGTWYLPDGFFGQLDPETNVTMPVTEASALEAFCQDFKLSRKPHEHGLSIVVPWLDDNDDDSGQAHAFDQDTLALAVLEGYFAPIIEGRLEVVIEGPNGSHVLRQESYSQVIETLSKTSTEDKERKAIARVRAYAGLAEAVRSKECTRVSLPACPDDKPQWTDEMVTDAASKEMRAVLDGGGILVVTATVTVRPKQGAATPASFSCFVKSMPDMFEKPCFIREDLIIPNVKSEKVNGLICIVRIENGALATLLGDAEGPAHTEWHSKSRNFDGKYVFGPMMINFVSAFAGQLYRRIYNSSRQLDRTLLDDLFHRERVSPEKPIKPNKSTTPKPKGEEGDPGMPPVPPPQGRGFRINGAVDGFVLQSEGAGLPIGKRIRIRAAYETSKGNPFGAYRASDFVLGDSRTQVVCEGCRIESLDKNIVVIAVDAPAFSVRASGFDTNRDLIVKADLLKSFAEEVPEAGDDAVAQEGED